VTVVLFTRARIFFCVCVVLGFELRASHLLSSSSPLEPSCQPFFVLSIVEIGSHELFAQTGFEL
jgi:hypothetical protein